LIEKVFGFHCDALVDLRYIHYSSASRGQLGELASPVCILRLRMLLGRTQGQFPEWPVRKRERARRRNAHSPDLVEVLDKVEEPVGAGRVGEKDGMNQAVFQVLGLGEMAVRKRRVTMVCVK
jgi:hypothetical protein